MKFGKRPETPERIDDFYYGETVDEAADFIENPDALKIIWHLLLEAKKARKRADKRPEWGQLLEEAELAVDAFSPLDLHRLCWRFFGLGQLTQRLTDESNEEKIKSTQEFLESLELANIARKTKFNTDLRNAMKKFVIEKTRQMAAELWEADIEQEYRIGEMAELVFKHLRSTESAKFVEFLPKKAASLKLWLKPVAPEYARKPGR